VTYAIDLLASARKLLTEMSGTPPSSSDCNRAVSTAYYAIFDCLCSLCANQLVGPVEPGSPASEAWVRVYRSLDHKQVSEALSKIEGLDEGTQYGVKIIQVALKSFLEARSDADYNRNKNFEPREALAFIGEASNIVHMISDANDPDDLWGLDLDAIAKSLTVELFTRKRR
jgi:uncharacterized protein (UPF0332 family)